MRNELKDFYEDEILKMIKGRDYQQTYIVIQLDSLNSHENDLLDYLETDLSDLFFGC
jgi:hypothetical protein